MDFIKIKLVEYGMAFIVAPLAVILVQLLKRYSVWVDQQGPWMKRSFVAVTVFVFSVLAQVTGIDFGVTAEESIGFLANIDATTIETLLGTATAFLLHALKKAAKK